MFISLQTLILPLGDYPKEIIQDTFFQVSYIAKSEKAHTGLK